MALLHKTQKQLLPSILFFSTLNATLAKKGQSSKAGILSTRQNIFSSPIQSFKQSQRRKKKFLCVTKNIALNQTTFVWREDFAFNQIVFFFLSLEEFYYDFCFFTKIIVLKRKAFSHRYATSRWQTSEKEKIFGGEKKLIHFEVQRGNLFWTLVILLIKHDKLLAMEQSHIFLFESAALNFFYRSIFFVTLNHQNCLMSTFENAWTLFERICAHPFFSIDEFFCWKLFDEKFLKTILKTYIVLRFTSTNVAYFWFWIFNKKCSTKRSFWTKKR